MTPREEFLNIYQQNITRQGSLVFLHKLEATDFFTAPASTQFHLSCEGGLCQHSVNVYHALKRLISMNFTDDVYSEDTIATVALLHDVCKANVYKVSTRNTKDAQGNWIKVPFYKFKDDCPYGHGEKSVMLISEDMHLSMEEKFAIRFHMGHSSDCDIRSVGQAFDKYTLPVLLSMADQIATHLIETKKECK